MENQYYFLDPDDTPDPIPLWRKTKNTGTNKVQRQFLAFLENYGREKPSKFPSRFISFACRCLMEGKISRGVFAEYLEINRTEIDEYLLAVGFGKENYAKIAAA